MNATELFRAGSLGPAIQALNEEVRQNPLDAKRRTFLFELLCFAGEWERGEKQLDVLAQGGSNAELGALMYRAALRAERQRLEFFKEKRYQDSAAPAADVDLDGETVETASANAVSGILNEQPFHEICDADPRLEVFAAGRYLWVPFAHIATLKMEAPKRLRDLLWAPAVMTNGAAFKGRDLGDVLIPVLSPMSFSHEEDAVRLGRATAWQEVDGAGIPFGQKLLLIDGEEVPLLEVRTLQVNASREAASAG
jgi:type VI secretion system protein ImpE